MPAMGRQLCRRTEAPQSEMLAPRNGDTWLCRQWGANSGARAGADLVQRERKNKGLRGFVHQPRAEKTGKGGPGTAQVGAPLPAKPYASVTGRQHFTLRIGRASPMLAPVCRQNLMPPLRGANILPWSAARPPAELAPHCPQSLVPPLRGANILP